MIKTDEEIAGEKAFLETDKLMEEGLVTRMTMKECLEKAAQVWCKPFCSRKEMDVDLAKGFAETLFELTNGAYTISSLCKAAFETSKAHGFTHDNDGQAIALMHSELSEALEAMRKPEKLDEHLPNLNPIGLELADVLIRVFDFCGARGIDLETCLFAKMKYNQNRPHKHGGKKF